MKRLSAFQFSPALQLLARSLNLSDESLTGSITQTPEDTFQRCIADIKTSADESDELLRFLMVRLNATECEYLAANGHCEPVYLGRLHSAAFSLSRKECTDADGTRHWRLNALLVPDGVSSSKRKDSVDEGYRILCQEVALTFTRRLLSLIPRLDGSIMAAAIMDTAPSIEVNQRLRFLYRLENEGRVRLLEALQADVMRSAPGLRVIRFDMDYTSGDEGTYYPGFNGAELVGDGPEMIELDGLGEICREPDESAESLSPREDDLALLQRITKFNGVDEGDVEQFLETVQDLCRSHFDSGLGLDITISPAATTDSTQAAA